MNSWKQLLMTALMTGAMLSLVQGQRTKTVTVTQYRATPTKTQTVTNTNTRTVTVTKNTAQTVSICPPAGPPSPPPPPPSGPSPPPPSPPPGPNFTLDQRRCGANNGQMYGWCPQYSTCELNGNSYGCTPTTQICGEIGTFGSCDNKQMCECKWEPNRVCACAAPRPPFMCGGETFGLCLDSKKPKCSVVGERTECDYGRYGGCSTFQQYACTA